MKFFALLSDPFWGVLQRGKSLMLRRDCLVLLGVPLVGGPKNNKSRVRWPFKAKKKPPSSKLGRLIDYFALLSDPFWGCFKEEKALCCA